MSIDFLDSIDLITAISFLIFLISAFIFFYNIKKKIYKKWYINILILRHFIFLLLITLLLNPIFNFYSFETTKLMLGIFVDNSASMKLHQQPVFNNFKSELNNFFKKIEKKNIPYESYLFDRDVKPFNQIGLNGNGLTTNLSEVAKNIDNNKNLYGALIFTDGVATEGVNPIKSFDDIKIPIYMVGVGSNNEMVDISIQTIDAPTVSFMNDDINFKSIIKSEGVEKKKATISLYQNKELIVSKEIFLNDKLSLNEVDFLFKPKKIGNQQFEVRVSSFEDEVNIQNNRERFNILILKNKYKVALLTGSPNKNTNLIKENLKKNERINFDHYVKVADSEFRPSINSFWSKPYELIIFDNFPIKDQSFDFVRILGKKIIANNSSFFLIVGPNQNDDSLNKIAALLDFKIVDYNDTNNKQNWNFKYIKDFTSLPPLNNAFTIRLENKYTDSLAYFNNQNPLWVRNEKNKIRKVLFLSPEMLKLKTAFLDSSERPSDLILNISISWLLQISGSKESYFRLNKKRLQLGEVVNISGNRLSELKNFNESLILKVSKEGKEIENNEFDFNIDLKRWEYDYRPPSSGIYNYEIFFEDDYSKLQKGEFEVLESKIELSNVFMNEFLLKNISLKTSANFRNWSERDSIVVNLSPKIKKEMRSMTAKFNENVVVVIFLLLLFIAELFLRKNKGLL